MTNEADIEKKFWKVLKSDRTLMLGLAGVEDDHSQPMTAQLDGDQESGPIWIFASKESHLVKAMGKSHRAFVSFASKDHELFASFHGELVADNDRAMIDKLWNPFVAAWYEGGKEDPKLQLLRLDPARGQVWINENSVFAGIKLLLSRDPKEDYKSKVANVNLKN